MGSLDVKGGYPADISNSSTPYDHQSTALPYPLLSMISGAMYSGVPHSVQVRPLTIWTKKNYYSFQQMMQLQKRLSLREIIKYTVYLAKTHIGNFQVALHIYQDVLGLQVPVDDVAVMQEF